MSTGTSRRALEDSNLSEIKPIPSAPEEEGLDGTLFMIACNDDHCLLM